MEPNRMINTQRSLKVTKRLVKKSPKFWKK